MTEATTYEWTVANDTDAFEDYFRLLLKHSPVKGLSIEELCNLLENSSIPEDQKTEFIGLLLKHVPLGLFKKKKDILFFLNLLIEKYRKSLLDANVLQNCHLALYHKTDPQRQKRERGTFLSDSNTLTFTLNLEASEIVDNDRHVSVDAGCTPFCMPEDKNLFTTPKKKSKPEYGYINYHLYLTLNVGTFEIIHLDLDLIQISEWMDLDIDNIEPNCLDAEGRCIYNLIINLNANTLLNHIAMLMLCKELIHQREEVTKSHLKSVAKRNAFMRSVPIESVRTCNGDSYLPHLGERTQSESAFMIENTMQIPNIWHKLSTKNGRSLFQTSKVNFPYANHTSVPFPSKRSDNRNRQGTTTTTQRRSEFQRDARLKLIKSPESGIAMLNINCDILPVLSTENRLNDDIYPTARNEFWYDSMVKYWEEEEEGEEKEEEEGRERKEEKEKEEKIGDRPFRREMNRFVLPPAKVEKIMAAKSGENRSRTHLCRDVLGSFNYPRDINGTSSLLTRNVHPPPIRYHTREISSSISVVYNEVSVCISRTWRMTGDPLMTNAFKTDQEKRQNFWINVLGYDTVQNAVRLLEKRAHAESFYAIDETFIASIQKYKNSSSWERLRVINKIEGRSSEERRGGSFSLLHMDKSVGVASRRHCNCRYYESHHRNSLHAGLSGGEYCHSRMLYELETMRSSSTIVKITNPYEFNSTFNLEDNSVDLSYYLKFFSQEAVLYVKRSVFDTETFRTSSFAERLDLLKQLKPNGISVTKEMFDFEEEIIEKKGIQKRLCGAIFRTWDGDMEILDCKVFKGAILGPICTRLSSSSLPTKEEVFCEKSQQEIEYSFALQIETLATRFEEKYVHEDDRRVYGIIQISNAFEGRYERFYGGWRLFQRRNLQKRCPLPSIRSPGWNDGKR